MTADRETALALADTFSPTEIRDYRTTALKVKLEGGTITRHYQDSSFTISRENCEQVIADTNAALAILATEGLGDDPDLTQEAICKGFDFRNRITA
jgi:hypothetical protein